MLKITDGVIVEMTAEEEEAIRGMVNGYNAQKARQYSLPRSCINMTTEATRYTYIYMEVSHS